MEKNVGGVDRMIIGIALIAILFLVDGGIKWIGLLGFVMLFSAFVGFCPLYKLFGINTCKQK